MRKGIIASCLPARILRCRGLLGAYDYRRLELLELYKPLGPGLWPPPRNQILVAIICPVPFENIALLRRILRDCRWFNLGECIPRRRTLLAHQPTFSFTCQGGGEKSRKRTTGLVWVTKRHLQEPTRRLARTFSSSTGVKRWCLHMCRQLQQCHCCCIHIHPSIASSPWMVPPPRLRSSGCIDQAKLLLGLQSRLHPNRSPRADVSSIQFCSWSHSVDA